MEPQVSLEARLIRCLPHWLPHPQPHFWAQLHPEGPTPANTGPVHSTAVGGRADRGAGGPSQKTRPAGDIHRTTDPGRDLG